MITEVYFVKGHNIYTSVGSKGRGERTSVKRVIGERGQARRYVSEGTLKRGALRALSLVAAIGEDSQDYVDLL